MSLNIVSFKAPKFKPMPGELTPAVINGATLPVKIGIAQRAIAACCDLSELLTWKDKLAALAAAAKMARMPEMARDVNRVHKEAIFRMGEILLQYKGTTERTGNKQKGGSKPSERTFVARKIGISGQIVSSAIRLAAAPTDVRKRLLEDDAIAPNPHKMVRPSYVPTRVACGGVKDSDAARIVFSGRNSNGHAQGSGLNHAVSSLRNVSFSLLSQLTPAEKQRARKLVIEMQEILDDIDRRLGPDTSVKS
jgi:hypothetical protein